MTARVLQASRSGQLRSHEQQLLLWVADQYVQFDPMKSHLRFSAIPSAGPIAFRYELKCLLVPAVMPQLFGVFEQARWAMLQSNFDCL